MRQVPGNGVKQYMGTGWRNFHIFFSLNPVKISMMKIMFNIQRSVLIY